MRPGDYDDFLAKEVDAFMEDDPEQGIDYADDGDYWPLDRDEASDYELMRYCP